MATDYTVNYEDERFAKVDADHEQRVNDVESTYAGIVGNTDQYYQAQIDATKEWEAKQSQLQQEQTDFTIEQIEQQKVDNLVMWLYLLAHVIVLMLHVQ